MKQSATFLEMILALDSLSVTAERTLKLLAKYLQNLANQVEFRTKIGHYGL